MFKVTARLIVEGSVAGLEHRSCSPAYSRQSSARKLGHMAAIPNSNGFGRGLCLAAVPWVNPDLLFLVPLPCHQNILGCPMRLALGCR